MIEQAVFTSAQTDRSRGYQLVAASPGINAEVARELITWGPSHGSLCATGDGESSVNYHPLSGGLWCVSQSLDAGEEYSGRGGSRVYTHSFVLTAEELARFANNPFALLRAIRNRGLLKVEEPAPMALAPFQLPGRSAAVDEGILAEFVERWGGERIVWFVETALRADALIVVGGDNRESSLAGLLNCLPVECRPELSFATGLVYSLRRPFRINAVEADETELRRLKRQPGVTVLKLNEGPPVDFVPSGWAAYLADALAIDALPLVCAELERSRAGLRLSDLHWLADQLTLRLHAPAEDAPRSTGNAGGGPEQPVGEFGEAEAANERFAGKLQLHSTAASSVTQADRPAGPSATLAAPSRDVLERLEHLDDLVFDTINGRRPALEELAKLWPQLAAELPADLMADSREQYLRYAIKLWESCVSDGVRDPSWAVAALDVLCVLFGGA